MADDFKEVPLSSILPGKPQATPNTGRNVLDDLEKRVAFRWTRQNEVRLKHLSARGMDTIQIAKELKTTAGVVELKLRRLLADGWDGSDPLGGNEDSRSQRESLLNKFKDIAIKETKSSVRRHVFQNYGILGRVIAQAMGEGDYKYEGKGRGGKSTPETIDKYNKAVLANLDKISSVLNRGTSAIARQLTNVGEKVETEVRHAVETLDRIESSERRTAKPSEMMQDMIAGKKSSATGMLTQIAAALAGIAGLTALGIGGVRAAVSPDPAGGLPKEDEKTVAPDKPAPPAPTQPSINHPAPAKAEMKSRELVFKAREVEFEAGRIEFKSDNDQPVPDAKVGSTPAVPGDKRSNSVLPSTSPSGDEPQAVPSAPEGSLSDGAPTSVPSGPSSPQPSAPPAQGSSQQVPAQPLKPTAPIQKTSIPSPFDTPNIQPSPEEVKQATQAFTPVEKSPATRETAQPQAIPDAMKLASFISTLEANGDQNRADVLQSMLNRAGQNYSKHGDLYGQLTAREQYSPMSAALRGRSADPHATRKYGGVGMTHEELKSILKRPDWAEVLNRRFGGHGDPEGAKRILEDAMKQGPLNKRAAEFLGGRTDFRGYGPGLRRESGSRANSFRHANADKPATSIEQLFPALPSPFSVGAKPLVGQELLGKQIYELSSENKATELLQQQRAYQAPAQPASFDMPTTTMAGFETEKDVEPPATSRKDHFAEGFPGLGSDVTNPNFGMGQ